MTATAAAAAAGDVCSLAAFDFQHHGNGKYGAPTHGAKAARSRQGKMEKSFLSFAATYPTWQPPQEGQQLISALSEHCCQAAAASGLAGGSGAGLASPFPDPTSRYAHPGAALHRDCMALDLMAGASPGAEPSVHPATARSPIWEDGACRGSAAAAMSCPDVRRRSDGALVTPHGALPFPTTSGQNNNVSCPLPHNRVPALTRHAPGQEPLGSRAGSHPGQCRPPQTAAELAVADTPLGHEPQATSTAAQLRGGLGGARRHEGMVSSQKPPRPPGTSGPLPRAALATDSSVVGPVSPPASSQAAWLAGHPGGMMGPAGAAPTDARARHPAALLPHLQPHQPARSFFRDSLLQAGRLSAHGGPGSAGQQALWSSSIGAPRLHPNSLALSLFGDSSYMMPVNESEDLNRRIAASQSVLQAFYETRDLTVQHRLQNRLYAQNVLYSGSAGVARHTQGW